MLAEVAEPQRRVAEHLAGVQLLLAEEDAEQGALAGPVAADEADLDVVRDGGVGVVEEDLFAVVLGGLGNLDQRSHRDAGPRVGPGAEAERRLCEVRSRFTAGIPRPGSHRLLDVCPGAAITTSPRGLKRAMKPG